MRFPEYIKDRLVKAIHVLNPVSNAGQEMSEDELIALALIEILKSKGRES